MEYFKNPSCHSIYAQSICLLVSVSTFRSLLNINELYFSTLASVPNGCQGDDQFLS